MKAGKVLKELKIRLKHQLGIEKGFLGTAEATGQFVEVARNKGGIACLTWVIDEIKRLEEKELK